MRITRAMQILGYVLLGIAGLVPLLDPGVHLTQRLGAWLVAYVTFGVTFHVGATAPIDRADRRRRLVALGVQTPAMVAMAAFMPCHFGAMTLVIVASQAALVLSPRATFAWVALQTLCVAIFLVPSCQMQEGLASITALAGFQGFAAVALFLARREFEARAELTRTHAELLATRSLLEEASRANERTRIARELHDVVGHDLTALGLQLEIATHMGQKEARAHLTKAQELNARLLCNVRDVVGTMRATEGPDLVTALQKLVAEVPGVLVHLDVPETLAVDETGRAECVLRCVQEIITNTLKHARAKNLYVRVRREGAEIQVDAHDDGCGVGEVHAGHGLRGMRARLEEMGGWLEVPTSPARAFSVSARLPARGGPTS